MDYEITYSNNINAGNAEIVVKGISNYTGTVRKEFTIEKAGIPQGAPQSEMTAAAGLMVSDVYLENGWEWSASDRNTLIAEGEEILATAQYTGADRDNYRILTVQVRLRGINCTHGDSSLHRIEGAIEATCTTDGYTGDKICTNCQTKIESGRTIPATGHSWESTPALTNLPPAPWPEANPFIAANVMQQRIRVSFRHWGIQAEGPPAAHRQNVSDVKNLMELLAIFIHGMGEK